MKLKDNKDHHIDKLFAQKLSQLEDLPSGNAWQTLEKRLEQKGRKKNKLLLWIPYAAAAAITLLIISVWLLKEQVRSSSDGTAIAQHGQIQSNKQPDKQTSVTDTSHKEKSEQDIRKEKDTAPVQPQTLAQHTVKPAKAQKPKAVEKKNVNTSVKGLDEKSKPAIEPVENTIAQLEKQPPTVIPPSAFTNNNNTTIVVTVQLEESEEVAEKLTEMVEEPVQKQSKAGRLLNTLRKIKKAEFDELGIRPETIVAYVKDKAISNNHTADK